MTRKNKPRCRCPKCGAEHIKGHKQVGRAYPGMPGFWTNGNAPTFALSFAYPTGTDSATVRLDRNA